jgi:hypothetical protein
MDTKSEHMPPAPVKLVSLVAGLGLAASVAAAQTLVSRRSRQPRQLGVHGPR